MGRSRAVLAVCVAALACAGGSAAARTASPTTQELTITGSGGVQLSCGLVLPADSPPAGGWPGLLLFPDTGQRHSEMEAIATADFAPAGFASLTCDARGTGASGGKFDLAGPEDVQDASDLFAWLAARPDVSDTEIGALGSSLGGAEVWNAAAAGVPFKAIVPVDTWTSLGQALTPDGVVKSRLLSILEGLYAPSNWDSTLSQARADLAHDEVTAAVTQALAARSSRGRLHSLVVPTLMIQSRHDLLFGLGQASAAYKRLAGPKRLYVGSDRAVPEALAWFEQYLAGGATVGGGVELEHQPSDGKTTSFAALPPTRSTSVNLPGRKTLTGTSALRRSVRLPGGPLETFGAGAVTVRYSGGTQWTRLVATVFLKGSKEPVTEGAAPLTAASGVVTIPLLDTAVLLPRGKELVIRIGPPSNKTLFDAGGATPGAQITIERVTLKLSVLRLAVSG